MMADFGVQQPCLFGASYRISEPVLDAVSKAIWLDGCLSWTKKMGKVSCINVPELSINRIPLDEVSLDDVS